MIWSRFRTLLPLKTPETNLWLVTWQSKTPESRVMISMLIIFFGIDYELYNLNDNNNHSFMRNICYDTDEFKRR